MEEETQPSTSHVPPASSPSLPSHQREYEQRSICLNLIGLIAIDAEDFFGHSLLEMHAYSSTWDGLHCASSCSIHYACTCGRAHCASCWCVRCTGACGCLHRFHGHGLLCANAFGRVTVPTHTVFGGPAPGNGNISSASAALPALAVMVEYTTSCTRCTSTRRCAATAHVLKSHVASFLVKHQWLYDSCWAFASAGNVESAWYLSGNALTSILATERAGNASVVVLCFRPSSILGWRPLNFSPVRQSTSTTGRHGTATPESVTILSRYGRVSMTASGSGSCGLPASAVLVSPFSPFRKSNRVCKCQAPLLVVKKLGPKVHGAFRSLATVANERLGGNIKSDWMTVTVGCHRDHQQKPIKSYQHTDHSRSHFDSDSASGGISVPS